ncbi:MAG: type II toxin-antitoxin system Phd/YefM family antitoxin, partial [Terrimicrobiaceae bacterium]
RFLLRSLTMGSTYSITEAQANFPALVRESQEHTITITRRDEVVGYLLSPERMEAIIESMEILANPKAMRAIRDYEKGRTAFHPLASLDE